MVEVRKCYSKDSVEFPNLYEVIPEKFGDNRGYFVETYSMHEFNNHIGMNINFVQDNQSMSSKRVMRGLHFQKVRTQDKLVRVISGKALDVVFDLRNDSPTFGKMFSIILDAEKGNQLFVPKGFAHGFVALEDNTAFCYKCSDYYCKSGEGGIKFKPLIDDPILSEKDLLWPEFDSKQPYFDMAGNWIGN